MPQARYTKYSGQNFVYYQLIMRIVRETSIYKTSL